MMRNTFLFLAVLFLSSACGARDEKNEAESYPTTDTSQSMEKINDKGTDTSEYGKGDHRHNIDR
jgi:hypothetical protein